MVRALRQFRKLPIQALLYLRRHPLEVESFAYGVFAAACTLWSAHLFFASMRFQLFLSDSHAGLLRANEAWSAPLDDVFIHFDFARSAARGHPFEWSEGNGYSSGGTSLLYPFVLAIGHQLGFQREDLMHWAGMVAVASVVYGLVRVRALASGLPRWCSWFLPPAFLSTGVLNWTLWSGMEVAFFFALWAATAASFTRLVATRPAQGLALPALSMGLGGALLTATRPEAAVIVACFTLVALAPKLSSVRPKTLASLFVLSAFPGALVIVAHSLCNRWFTGDFAAAGALVKLEMNHPYLTAREVFEAWKFHFGYQVLRVTNYHLSSSFDGSGWAAWLLALLACFDRRTRSAAVLLWASVLSFTAVVALNGQVRWQNERYAMPALAWLLVNAGLGLGVGASWLVEAVRRRRARQRVRSFLGHGLVGALSLGLAAFFWTGQVEAEAGQRWFFGRASRNIFDQHMNVGARLRHANPGPSRVLVGDAGAIPFIADVPALDIIGLGGFHDLPFARATRHGVAAALELIERIPPVERPDVMALYPGWWGDFPLWFGTELWSAPVRGNVICGGPEKVVYRPDWSPFLGSQRPTRTKRRDHVAWELDVADLVSEKASATRLLGTLGHVAMKLLPFPGDRTRDLWDAGRILPRGGGLGFVIHGVTPHEPLRLVFRVAPVHSTLVRVFVNGAPAGELALEASDQWQEPELSVPATLVDPTMEVRLQIERDELVLYHLWGIQER